MGLGRVAVGGIRAVRCLASGVAKESSGSYIGYGAPLEALAKARSRSALRRAVEEFGSGVKRCDERCLESSGSAAPVDVVSRHVNHGDIYVGSTCSSQSAESQGDVARELDASAAFCAALLNVVRQRCTDVAVWSILCSQLPPVWPKTGRLDLATTNRILYGLSRFKCHNSIVQSKVDLIVATLLESVGALARRELARGVIDLKLQVQRSLDAPQNVDNLGEIGHSCPAIGGDVRADGVRPNYEDVWKLWYVLNTSASVRNEEVSQLLLEVLESRRQEVCSFDLGRTLRTMTVMLQRSESLSRVEEKLLMKLFKRMLMLLNVKGSGSALSPGVVSLSGDSGVSSGAYSTGESQGCDAGGKVGHDREALGGCVQGNDKVHVLTRQGNLYVTVGHVHSAVKVLSVLCKRLPMRSFSELLVSSRCVNGLGRLFETAEVVVGRSVALEARMREAEVANTGWELEMLSESGFPNSRRSLWVLHVKILGALVEFGKHLDLVSSLDERHSAELRPLRGPLWSLCGKLLGGTKHFDPQLNASQVRAAYYLLLSAAANGECRVDTMDKVVDWVVEITRTVAASGLLQTHALDVVAILVHVDKLLSLLKELEVMTPAMSELVGAARDLLKRHGGVARNGNTVVVLQLLQKHNMLSVDILSEHLRGWVDSSTKLWEWERRDVAMLCDLLVGYVVETNRAPLACDGSMDGVDLVDGNGTGDIVLARQLLASMREWIKGGDGKLSSWNHDQMLSLARCCVVLCGNDDMLVKELQKRCGSMNFHQCLKCLELGLEALGEVALRRMALLLSRKQTLVDLTHALEVLCGNVGAIAVSVPEVSRRRADADGVGATDDSDVKHREDGEHMGGQGRTFYPEALRRLHALLSATEREVVVLDDVCYIQRRLQKRLHRAIGLGSRSAVPENPWHDEAPVIMQRTAAKQFVATFRATKSGLYDKINNAILI
ncbi:metallo-beta-lactamase, putative [Babesia caballi]|uniref:Metallo-beta-lactamase, putative n=1 Tax=Babesia caballi TaxID=5871 RepID=A0AAV4M3M2_BABCB|nr:metallo-beta-lactamase, putative [Babesia caballi]